MPLDMSVHMHSDRRSTDFNNNGNVDKIVYILMMTVVGFDLLGIIEKKYHKMAFLK